jgi:hypothetical protein
VATSLKLVHTSSNNFYFRAFSINCSTLKRKPAHAQSRQIFQLKKNFLRGTLFGHTALTCQYFSVATSVKLVLILNNNFYSRDFPISCKTFWSMLVESRQIFNFNLLSGDLLRLSATYILHTQNPRKTATGLNPFFSGTLCRFWI